MKFFIVIYFGMISFQLRADHTKGPRNGALQTMPMIAQQLSLPNPSFPQLFSKIENLEAFLHSDVTPKNRSEGLMPQDEAFQEGIEFLINAKKIKSGDFIISDTGHDIPLLYQILSHQRFSVQYAFHFPKNYLEDDDLSIVHVRTSRQAQRYGDAIAELSKKMPSKAPDLFFLGLEVHRNERYFHGMVGFEIDGKKLPSMEDLKSAGVQRLIYLVEAHPLYQGHKSPLVERDVLHYLLEAAKHFDIRVVGADCRGYDLIGLVTPTRFEKGCDLKKMQEVIQSRQRPSI